MTSAQIKATNIKELSTVHGNFVEKIQNLFVVSNSDNPNVLEGYNETTKLLQAFLADALQKQKSVRALGGNWSWTKVGYTNDWMLSTTRLNRMKRTLPEEIHADCGPFVADAFLFAQCGCSVLELNRVLGSLGRSLKTSGASNGQTIVGLISNGTHGSAIDYGSTPEFVVGLHLVLGPSKHVYLERASKPVVTDAFVRKIGADWVKDDALFNAALVSFGSFGLIHGVMIETDPLFLYNVFRKQVTPQMIRPLLQTLDFNACTFLPRNGRPFHFQVIINPYAEVNGCHVTVMYKEKYRDDYPHMLSEAMKAGPGEDAPILLGKLTQLFPVITSHIVNTTMKSAYQDIENAWGTHGEIFGSSQAMGRVLSMAMGVAAEHTNQVLEMAQQLSHKHSFVGIFACRFVAGTKATLGFTRFPITCVAEFDSFEAKSTWQFYHALWDAMDTASIPYTFHWGKVNRLNASNLRKMYGQKIDEWIAARNKLLPAEMLPVFTNSFMKETGLDKRSVLMA